MSQMLEAQPRVQVKFAPDPRGLSSHQPSCSPSSIFPAHSISVLPLGLVDLGVSGSLLQMPCHPGSVCFSKCLVAPVQPWPWVRKQNQQSLETPCDHTSGKDKSPDKHTGQAGSVPEGLIHSPALIHSLIHSFTPSSIYLPLHSSPAHTLVQLPTCSSARSPLVVHNSPTHPLLTHTLTHTHLFTCSLTC